MSEVAEWPLLEYLHGPLRVVVSAYVTIKLVSLYANVVYFLEEGHPWGMEMRKPVANYQPVERWRGNYRQMRSVPTVYMDRSWLDYCDIVTAKSLLRFNAGVFQWFVGRNTDPVYDYEARGWKSPWVHLDGRFYMVADMDEQKVAHARAMARMVEEGPGDYQELLAQELYQLRRLNDEADARRADQVESSAPHKSTRDGTNDRWR